jgi:peptide/nickel transport system permease protein
VKPRRKINWPLLFGFVFVAFILFLAWFGPSLAPQNPMQENYTLKVDGKVRTPPYPPLRVEGYPLGTDRFGRDLLSRMLWGVRPTLMMVSVVALTRLLLGILIGLAAGWSRGRVGRALDSLISLSLSIPALISALVGIFIVGIDRGLFAFVVGLGWMGWAETSRMVAEQTRALKSQTFVEASRALGGTSPHILFRHILRHILSLAWMLLAFEVSASLMVSAELGFLGYYVGGGIWIELTDFNVVNAEGLPELGQMISSALYRITDPSALLIVGTILVIGVLGFNLLGEGLRLRQSQEWMQGGRRFRMISVQTEAWLEERVIQPLGFWLEEHRAKLIGSVVLVVALVAAYVTFDRQRVETLAPASEEQTVTFSIPGNHLWATDHYDPFGTLSVPLTLEAEPPLLWSAPIPGGPTGGPVVAADGTIYVAGVENILLAFDANGNQLWQVLLESQPIGAPALDAEGRVLVADLKGGLTAVSPEGSVLWRAQISGGRESTSGPIVDSHGNAYVTITDAVGAVDAQGQVLWYKSAADAYLQEPPRLSADQTMVYLRNTAMDAATGAIKEIPIRDPSTLVFADPSFFTGGNGLNYYRPGHEIVGWHYDGDQLATDTPITWDYSGVVLLLPVDQGVSRNGMAWLFYTTSWTDSNMVWMDAQSRLLGNYRYARMNGRLVAIGLKDEAYICGGNTASVLCVCLYPGEEEPRWSLEFDTIGNVVGGALIPNRLLLSVSYDGLYVFGK